MHRLTDTSLQTLNGNWSCQNYVSYVFQAEIDTRSSDLYKLMKTGEKMIRQGHYAKEEVRSALSWETTRIHIIHKQYTHTHTHNTQTIHTHTHTQHTQHLLLLPSGLLHACSIYCLRDTHRLSHISHIVCMIWFHIFTTDITLLWDCILTYHDYLHGCCRFVNGSTTSRRRCST